MCGLRGSGLGRSTRLGPTTRFGRRGRRLRRFRPVRGFRCGLRLLGRRGRRFRCGRTGLRRRRFGRGGGLLRRRSRRSGSRRLGGLLILAARRGEVLANPASDGRLHGGGCRLDEFPLILEPGQNHLRGDPLASGVELLRELVNAWFCHFSPVRLPTPDRVGASRGSSSPGTHRVPISFLPAFAIGVPSPGRGRRVCSTAFRPMELDPVAHGGHIG